MQSIILPVTLSKQTVVGPFIRRRLDHQVIASVVMMQVSKERLPLMNPIFRALSSVLLQAITGAEAVAAGNTVESANWGQQQPSKAIRHVVRTYVAVARAVDALALQQKLRFVQYLMERDGLVNLLLQGSALEGEAHGVTPEGLVDMCLNNRGAGPHDSELHVIRMVNKFIGMSNTAKSLLPTATRREETRLPTMIEICTYIRLLELFKKQFELCDRTVPGNANFTPDEMVATTVRNLRSAAASLAGVLLSARVSILQHLLAVLSHPWFAGALTGHASEQYHNALAEVERKSYPVSGWADWNEINAQGIIDRDLAGIYWRSIPQRLVKLNPATINDYVLYGDLTTDVRINEQDPIRMLENLWTIMTACDHDAQLLHDAQTSGDAVDVIAGTTISLTTPSSANLDLPATITEAHGYPSLSEWDPVNFCLPNDKVLVAAGMNRWEHTTTAAVQTFTKNSLDYFPITIRGSAPQRGIPMYKTIVPVFKPWDHLSPYLPVSYETLAKLWEVDELELRRALSSLLSQARPVFLRALAEALRFVGVLMLKKGSEYTPQTPMVGHIYHALPATILSHTDMAKGFKSDLTIASAKDIVLNQSPDDAPRTDETAGVELELILRPFDRIPLSADISTMGNCLSELIPRQTKPSASIVRWIRDTNYTTAFTDRLQVVGWRVADANVADIILAATQDETRGAASYFSLFGHDDYSPTLGRRGNAIMSLLADGAPNPYAPNAMYADPIGVELELNTK